MAIDYDSESERPVLWYAWAPPHLVRVDNLRKRGVDMLRIRLLGTRENTAIINVGIVSALLLVLSGMLADLKWLFVAAGVAALVVLVAFYLNKRANRGSWYLTLAPGMATVSANGFQAAQFSFADVRSLTVREPGISQLGALEVGLEDRSIAIGVGHPIESLNWLKNTLSMEMAGLTWKPLHGVDRKRSRNLVAVEDNPSLINPELAKRLISIYLSLAPDVLDQLKEAIGMKSPVLTRQLAHWLKSASANIGARQLSELYQRLQICGIENDFGRADILLQEVDKQHTLVVRWLDTIRDTAATQIALKFPEPESSDKSIPAKPAAEGEAVHHASVLVVDDSIVSRELATEFLSGLVSDLTFAGSAEEALALWQASSFRLILMDCELPGMDGYECTRRLRQRERVRGGNRVPIIALTAHALKGDRDQCIAAGMDDYLSKPYSPEELMKKVEEWLHAPVRPASDSPAEGAPIAPIPAEFLVARGPEPSARAARAVPAKSQAAAPQGNAKGARQGSVFGALKAMAGR